MGLELIYEARIQDWDHQPHCTTALHSTAGRGRLVVACVNWVKDPLKQACYSAMDALGGVSSSPTSLSLFKNGGNTSCLRTPLRGGRRREERRWTVHSKCCSTGSACPVAIGHRVNIQQEMLKERHSDLLGELCLFASVGILISQGHISKVSTMSRSDGHRHPDPRFTWFR